MQKDKPIEIIRAKQLFIGELSDVIPAVLLMLYLCADFFDDLLRRILPASTLEFYLNTMIEDVIFLFLLLLYYGDLVVRRKKKTTVWPIITLSLIFILITILTHPEYSDWYHNSTYGLQVYFYSLKSGFFAVLFFSVLDAPEKIVSVLVHSNRINFIYYLVQFIYTYRRGYWISYNSKGELIHLSYNLGFGYKVAICAVICLVLFVFNRKLLDFGMFALSSVIILMQGSRGAIVCILAAILLMTIYQWRINRNTMSFFVILTSIASVILLIFYIGPSEVGGMVIGLLSKLGAGSRSIQMIIAGNFADGNGREKIWEIANQMIRDGNFFGYGFYGDRYVIGRYWAWGYPHNIFLEILIQFGKTAGGILIAVLVWNIIKMGIRTTDASWQFLYIVLLSCSTKLLLSDSFWYYWPFWALLAVMCNWNQTRKMQGLNNTGGVRFVWKRQIVTGR